MKALKVRKTVSKGIVTGKAFIVKRPDLTADKSKISENATGEEIKRYDSAAEKVKAELEVLAQKSDIFAAHCALVEDIALYDGIIDKIKTQMANAELAVDDVCAEFVAVFESMTDEYMRERAADMKDIRNRLVGALKGIEDTSLKNIREKVIVIAEDLAPSDTAAMDLNYVLGFITEQGGVTSHVSIIAKNLGLPALVGAAGILEAVKDNDNVIIDAAAGDIFINPDEEMIREYTVKSEEFFTRRKELEELSHLPAVTANGKTVELCANVGSIEEIKNAKKYHIDGIGLFRSEFLYMEGTHFPTEEEQFKVYKEAAELLEGKEVTVRTLDVGGDKGLPYFEFEPEENPFLGYRAIRISLELKDMFKEQLRALLRASAFGHIRIMYPMIISMEELKESNALLEVCKNELRNEGIAFDENVEVGIMVETPASVICAEEFAGAVDFFSIGTNDLTQYMLAVDRGNKKISHLYDSFNPAVLKAIKQTIDAGHAKGIKVGMCGEMAGELKALPILLEMGLDEFSMSAGNIPEIKYELRKLTV